ncbi:hypothetical protein JOB18_008460 [Solea senegalensis]|uniref:Uncharacterized protein n=1 Tax=Solea senegalensis TaxID=28829 RepID=A0AAV6RK52_SOLSE|nr:hypothetical protein JOB18_008460 [Solea senegalensis]
MMCVYCTSVTEVTDKGPACHNRRHERCRTSRPCKGMKMDDPLLWLGTSLATQAAAMKEMQRCARVVKASDSHDRKALFLRSLSPPDVCIHGVRHGKDKRHQALPVAGSDFGHHRPRPLLRGHLRAAEFLGLLRVLGTFAHLPQPDPVDLLVHGEPHRV